MSKIITSEIKEKYNLIIKAISFGLTFAQACQLASIHRNVGYSWLRADPDFKEEVESAKSKNMQDLSAQMHVLAKNGNYQALSFLLSKSPDSPFRDGAIHLTDEEIDAMERVMTYLCEVGGLLPIPDSDINPFLKKAK
jgi:hypothetical protein